MHVQNVQLRPAYHFRHFRRQDKVIWGIFEQRIRQNLNFMEVNPITRLETNRKRITYEVDLVTYPRQFPSQFCAYDSAAAVGRVACNTNPHIAPDRLLKNSLDDLKPMPGTEALRTSATGC